MPAHVTIEHTPDPNKPNRLLYKITGPSRDAVQFAISDIMNRVSDGSGYAVFSTPQRCGNSYVGHGAVVIHSAEAVA